MGERVSVDDLRRRAGKFFARVMDILQERNGARGDTYLDMGIEEFGSFIRDKASRIKSAQRVRESSTSTEAITSAREDQTDSALDIAGYAALLYIKMIETEGFKEKDFGIE